MHVPQHPVKLWLTLRPTRPSGRFSQALRHGATHTDEPPARAKRAASGVAAYCEERAIPGKAGLAIAPTRGTLLVFYTRDRAGQIDPCAWHGGMGLHASAPGKWTCQKFFEVPPEFRPREGDHDHFAAARLRDCCVRYVPGELEGVS